MSFQSFSRFAAIRHARRAVRAACCSQPGGSHPIGSSPSAALLPPPPSLSLPHRAFSSAALVSASDFASRSSFQELGGVEGPYVDGRDTDQDKRPRKQKLASPSASHIDPSSFEVDWSAISLRGLHHTFVDLLADFILPEPPPISASTGAVAARREARRGSGGLSRRRSRVPSLFEEIRNQWRRSSWHVDELYGQRGSDDGSVGASRGSAVEGRSDGRGVGMNRFLIRGIIYDMSALMVFDKDLASGNERDASAVPRRVENAAERQIGSPGQDAGQGLTDFDQEKLQRAELATRDWEKFLLGGPRKRSHVPGVSDSSASSSGADATTGAAGGTAAAGMPSTSAVTQGISLDEMAESMGLPTSARTSLKRSSSGSANTNTSTRSSSSSPNSPLPETPAPLGGAPLQFRGGGSTSRNGRGASAEQRLEELLAGGTGGGVRAKYGARLQEKKMLAEARREQQGGGFAQAAAAVASAAAAASTAAAAASAARLRAAKGGEGGMLVAGMAGGGRGVGGIGWVVAPGSARMLRHFQSRTLKQALLTTHSPLDVLHLIDQLGNFAFDSRINSHGRTASAASSPTSSPLLSTSSASSPGQQSAAHQSAAASPSAAATPGAPGATSDKPESSPAAAPAGPAIDSLEAARKRVDEFHDVCKRWNLKPSQVLVVLGSGRGSSYLSQALQDSPFFICQMSTYLPGPARQARADWNAPSSSQSSKHFEFRDAAAPPNKAAGSVEDDMQGGSVEHPRHAARETGGWAAWWKQLSEGTLHKNGEDGGYLHVGERREVADWLQSSARFKAADMVELKGVVEELNGVSYRSSTFMHAQGRG